MNNLAAVLWELGPRHRQSALNYVDRALNLAGPQPPILDTKALLLVRDDTKQAIRLLLEATAIPNPDPRFHFHLAVAYQLDGDPQAAQQAFREALDNDLSKYTLTATEKTLLNELKKYLARNQLEPLSRR